MGVDGAEYNENIEGTDRPRKRRWTEEMLNKKQEQKFEQKKQVAASKNQTSHKYWCMETY